MIKDSFPKKQDGWRIVVVSMIFLGIFVSKLSCGKKRKSRSLIQGMCKTVMKGEIGVLRRVVVYNVSNLLLFILSIHYLETS